MGSNTSEDRFHDPFAVLFGYLAGVTQKLGFSTGVLILRSARRRWYVL